MTKSFPKIAAQNLRRRGYSFKDIAIKLSVSKSTVSRWCRGIKLTEKQKNKLFFKKVKGLKQGRIKGILTQKQKRLEKIKWRCHIFLDSYSHEHFMSKLQADPATLHPAAERAEGGRCGDLWRQCRHSSG